MFYRLRRIRKLFPLRFHTEFLYEHSLDSIPTIDFDPSLEIRVLSGSDLTLLRQVWNINMEKARERINRGDLCFAAFLSGRITSYHWVQYSGSHYLQQAGRSYPVLPDEGWIYHVRVAGWARGRNINSKVYSTILSDARTRGKCLIHVYTSASNSANQKGLARCGFKLTRKLVSFQSGRNFFLLYKFRGTG